MGRPRPGDRRHAAPRSAGVGPRSAAWPLLSAGVGPLRRVAAPFGRGRPAPRLLSAGSARSAPPFRRVPLRGTAHGSPGARPGRAARDSHDRACSPTIFAGAAGFGPPATLPKAARPASGSPGERLVETPGAGPRAAPSWCRCAGKRCRGPGHSLPWPRAFPAVAPSIPCRGPGQSPPWPRAITAVAPGNHRRGPGNRPDSRQASRMPPVPAAATRYAASNRRPTARAAGHSHGGRPEPGRRDPPGCRRTPAGVPVRHRAGIWPPAPPARLRSWRARLRPRGPGQRPLRDCLIPRPATPGCSASAARTPAGPRARGPRRDRAPSPSRTCRS